MDTFYTAIDLTMDTFYTAIDLAMDTFIRPNDIYFCSTPRCTSPSPSCFLTYSKRTIHTLTDLTMDSSFSTDSTITNLTSSTLSSTTSDTDSLSINTDTVLTIPSIHPQWNIRIMLVLYI